MTQAALNLACACCRYERASHVKGESQRFGRALVQRHVALPGDIANQEGRGVLVRSGSKLHCNPRCCRAVMWGLHCLRGVSVCHCQLVSNTNTAMGPDSAPAKCGSGQHESQDLAAVTHMLSALMQVRKESLEDPHILGQVQSKSSSYL